jgi:protocatechuate 3,4-dioxygenase beta subunit
MTDEEGNYKFTKLPSGEYTITALNKYFDAGTQYKYEPYLYSPKHIIELTKDTSGIDFIATDNKEYYSVSGKVSSDEEGINLLEGVTIEIKNELNSQTTTTNEDGFYIFEKVEKGDYNIKANLEGYDFKFNNLGIRVDQNRTNVNFVGTNYKYHLYGFIYYKGNPLDDIEVVLDSIENGASYTTKTDENGRFWFNEINIGQYIIYPKSEEFKFEPNKYEFFLNDNFGDINFIASPISSVNEIRNFEIKNNVLVSKDNVGMKYSIFSLSGRVLKSANLPKELNLNAHPTGTYILHISKGEQIIFTHKFQVVR